MTNRQIRAVIFDLGGVVYASPLEFIRGYEERHHLPARFIADVLGGYGGAGGPWHRLECGEIDLPQFCQHFDADIARAGGGISSADLMREMAANSEIRPSMLAAIRKLRSSGLLVAALTNNWMTDDGHDERLRPLREEFHVFVESCKVGMRKPDRGIYDLTCEKLEVTPKEAVFLDDMGQNLKTARALGMTTIKVGEPGAALGQLGGVVGMVF